MDQAHLNRAVRAAVSAACNSPPPPPPKPIAGVTTSSPAHFAQRLQHASTGGYCAAEDGEDNDGPMPPPPPPLPSVGGQPAGDDEGRDHATPQHPALVQLACASVSTGDSVTDSPLRFAVIPESPPFSAAGEPSRSTRPVECASVQYDTLVHHGHTPNRPISSASYPAGRPAASKQCNAVGAHQHHVRLRHSSGAQPAGSDDDAMRRLQETDVDGDLNAMRPSTSTAAMDPVQSEPFVSLACALEPGVDGGGDGAERERSVSPSLRPLAVCQIHAASCSDCRHVFADFLHTSTAEPNVERAFLHFGNRTCTSYRLKVASLRNPVDVCALPNGCLAVADYDNGFMVLNRAGDVVRHDAVADRHNACGVAAICLPDGHFRFVVLAYKDGVWSINIYTSALELKETVLCPDDGAIETWAVRKMSLAADGRLYLMATGEHKLAIWSYEFESRTWRTLVTENSRKGAYNDFAARYDTETHETHFLLCDWRKAQLSTIVVTERVELAGIQSIKMRRAKGQEWIVQGPKLARWDSRKDILMYDGSGKVFLFDGRRYRCMKIVADMGRGEVGALATAGGWCFILCRHRCALEAYLYAEPDADKL